MQAAEKKHKIILKILFQDNLLIPKLQEKQKLICQYYIKFNSQQQKTASFIHQQFLQMLDQRKCVSQHSPPQI